MSSGPNVEDYAPGWVRVDPDSWRMVDDIGVMHLLLKDTPPGTDAQRRETTRFYELHGLTLHIYRGPDEVRDAVWPLGDPTRYDPAVHNYTHEVTIDVSSTALALYKDEDGVWEWLRRYARERNIAL